MALNPNYVPLTPLWEVFTDKDLLTFLSDGYVKFYVDTARTVGKPVYQLTGSPPNYSYTQYGFLDTDGSWRVNMNLQGAFDQVIYGYPLDEFGEVQLYFADFFNVDGVFQFSREGFPNFFAPGGSITTPVDINFIPDGQFRLHTDIPSTLTTEVGQVQQAVTPIAFGGWTFERPSASIARDFVTFQRIGSFVTNPVKSPRYAVEIICEAPNAGDTFKDLRVRFDDVNKFSSDTDMFTFGITGQVVSGGDIDVELVLIKNFGTGGDPTSETNLTTFTLTNTFTAFSFSFVFGANTGSIIGPLNDDFVQIALRMPSNELFDVEFTDALLTPGNVLAPTFNDTTTREFLYESLFDDTDCPAFDGSDIGLPLVLTKTGLRFDDSQVGFIFPASSFGTPFGFLTADGARYDTLLHSSDGIPFSRLGTRITLALMTPLVPLNFNIPAFGTGSDFLIVDILSTKDLKISTNMRGATGVPTDGVVPTGFTFFDNHDGQINIDATGKITTPSTFYTICDAVGVTTAPDNGTFPITSSVIINAPSAKNITEWTTTGVTAPGQYFRFDTPTQIVTVWFQIDGAGVAPVVPGTPVKVNIKSGSLDSDQYKIIADSISGFQVSQITTVAASLIPQNAYFNLNTSSQSYYVWYNKDNGGVDPMIVGKIGIEVDILSADTKDIVTSKTATSINTRYFATPDIRGLFLKGYDGTLSNDLNAALRYSENSVTYGNVIGTREYSNNIGHNHEQLVTILQFTPGVGQQILSYDYDNATGNNYIEIPLGAGGGPETRPLISYQGASESRPENITVNYLIKY